MKGSGIIGAYHARRVAPLMARALPLYQMVPEASFEGTVLVDKVLPYSEVAQRIKEASPLTSCIRCRGIPRCDRNRGLLTS